MGVEQIHVAWKEKDSLRPRLLSTKRFQYSGSFPSSSFTPSVPQTTLLLESSLQKSDCVIAVLHYIQCLSILSWIKSKSLSLRFFLKTVSPSFFPCTLTIHILPSSYSENSKQLLAISFKHAITSVCPILIFSLAELHMNIKSKLRSNTIFYHSPCCHSRDSHFHLYWLIKLVS